jgi:hypothetical protein
VESVALQECTTLTAGTDNIPGAAAGDLVLTRKITPQNANNLLHITAKIPIGLEDGRTGAVVSLHKDGGVAVDAAYDEDSNAGADAFVNIPLDYWVVAGGVAEITYTLRVGTTNIANDVWVNGLGNGSRILGGVMRAIMIIEEIKA